MFRYGLIVWGLFASVAIAADSGPVPRDIAEEASSSVVDVICRVGNTNRGSRSRGVILAGGSEIRRAEVIITTGHGVRYYNSSQPRQCWIVDADGVSHDIISVIRPQGMNSSFDDWAIILTEDDFAHPEWRLPIAWSAASQSAPRSVALLGRNHLATGCTLRQSDRISDGGERVRIHDCGSRHGLSGAPLLTLENGKLSVIGVNVGRVTGFDGQSIAVVFDEGLIASTVEGTLQRAAELQQH
ncbi:hypothetical protein [Hyphobacterium sp.]|uniref:hypothetical protein n=1 Tax=Hyphobacterium sp. TaxID=2004662 RepID=UPI003BA9EC02